MSAIVIVGAQWGDEGKGKVVDLLTESAQMVCRYAGGANAGHTLVVGDKKVVMRLLPSGVLRPGVKCVLGQGMVIDPVALDAELVELEKLGRDARTEVLVSPRAHLILPYHQLIDGLRESAASPGRAIGTTKRGIGPAYEDKMARRGVMAGLLRDPAAFEAAVARAVENWGPQIERLGGAVPPLKAVVEPALGVASKLVPLFSDTSVALDGALKRGERVLLEGAQGTLLDIDHGTYPFVTSSSAVAGGACTGLGIGPSRIKATVGITKAYTTRVGAGPFPTELHDELGERIRQVGGEFGSVTGRPRRTGWLDLPALRYAIRVNGLDYLAFTKLDVLTGLSEVKACVAYETRAGRTEDFPLDAIERGEEVKPVFEAMPGWTENLAQARKLDELPAAALRYVRLIEEKLGVPFFMVSVGPRRDETILFKNPFE